MLLFLPLFGKWRVRGKETVPKTNGVNLIHIIEQLNGNQIPSTYCLPDNGSVPFWPFRRATVKKGVTFRTATPTNSLLWDITLDMGADGVISVVCQRKAPVPGKRQVHSFYGCRCQLSFLLKSPNIISMLNNNVSNYARWHLSVHLCTTIQTSALLKADISLLRGHFAAFLKDTTYPNELQVQCRCSGNVPPENFYTIICIPSFVCFCAWRPAVEYILFLP